MLARSHPVLSGAVYAALPLSVTVAALMGLGPDLDKSGSVLTRRGVPLFWPITSAHVRVPPGLATGGPGETIAMLIGLVVCGWRIVATG